MSSFGLGRTASLRNYLPCWGNFLFALQMEGKEKKFTG
jgi:hypothetical protein